MLDVRTAHFNGRSADAAATSVTGARSSSIHPCRRYARQSAMADAELANGNKGAVEGELRGHSRAHRRCSATTHRRQGLTAHAGRRSLARRRTSHLSGTKILSRQSAGRRRSENVRCYDQGALDLRTDASTTENSVSITSRVDHVRVFTDMRS